MILFSSGRRGKYICIKKQSSFVDLTQKLFPILFVSLLLLAILLIGLLSYLVSRSVIKPIFVLKGATEKIKEGNLDFQIPITSHDEIGQLNQGFEK